MKPKAFSISHRSFLIYRRRHPPLADPKTIGFHHRIGSHQRVGSGVHLTLGCKSFGLLLTAAACLLLLPHAPVTSASPGWSRQRISSLAWLHAVFFVDQNRGWAAGSKGALLATVDGGKTWQVKSAPTEDSIREIYFADANNGLIVCERNVFHLKSNNEARAYIMRTSDGGERWKRTIASNIDARLVRAVFQRSGRGWAFGEGGALFMTRDGGLNWSRSQAPTRFLLMGASFLDDNNGWVVGAGSTILQTTDGGETWEPRALPNEDRVRFYATSFVDARLGWAVGSGGAIFRTVNGGRSWRKQESGVTSDLLDVKFLDALEGWAVGDEGTLLHTTDGGIRWIRERSVTSHALERIFFTDRTHGWAVGFGGTIISYGSTQMPRLK